MHVLRYVKMQCKRVSLSIVTLFGNLDGVHLSGRLIVKKKYIWVPFLDSEGNKILSMGAIWNIRKGTGLS